jgi:hypothetical protein
MTDNRPAWGRLGAAVFGVIGVLLLLPGACSVVFLPGALMTNRSDGIFMLGWGLVLGVFGVALITKAIKRLR